MTQREFELLAQRYVDGKATPDDVSMLNEHLRDDSAKRQWLIELLDLDSALAAAAVGSSGQMWPERSAEQRVPPRRRRFIPSVIAALALVVASVTFFVARYTKGPVERQTIGWIDAENPPRDLKPGDCVRQTGGQMAVRFNNGVQLTLSGGAVLDVISTMSVRLHSGQMQADVGEFGRGFTVLTNSTDVTDLGTVFGVEVHADGPTDVVVFEGEVELSRKSGQNSNFRRQQNLNSGEAVRIQSSGEHARLPVIWRDSGDSRWSSEPAFPGRSVISAVRDNLATESRPKFYEIVPGGFREDAKVYVDRPYEWNGLDESGLVPELVGADYIRTFNDDKRADDLEIVVELRGPAALYVLIDARYPTPDWLAADFSRTDFRIGIDLGSGYSKERQVVPPLGISVRRWLERGPGNSVDVPVTVWKREVGEVSEVRFGPVPTGVLPTGRGNMYGIVAVPLTNDQ